MKHRERLRWLANDTHGVVTTVQARELGVPAVELRKLAVRGALRQVGRGVYRMLEVPPDPLTEYAEAIALVGPQAIVADESALAVHNLALVNPKVITIRTPRRIRAALPKTIKVLTAHQLIEPTYVDSVATMPIPDALIACKGRIMRRRLEAAAEDARVRGLISDGEIARVLRLLA